MKTSKTLVQQITAYIKINLKGVWWGKIKVNSFLSTLTLKL